MEYLSKVIYQRPKPIKQSSVLNPNNMILEANHICYKEDKSLKGWMSWGTGIGLIFIASIMLLFFRDDNFGINILFWIIFGFPGIVAIVYGFIAPTKIMVFHRSGGIITVAPRFQKTFDIPFETGVGIRVFTHNETSGVDQHLSFSVSKEKKRKGGVISMVLVDDSWAFTVWYMDKNRPLPPGDAFDTYREQDFARRKEEGFPPPLYKSKIPTPEATKEQQREREKYWTDGQYMI